MHSNDHDEDDYEVGYRRPPKQHRFKKGQSGNPKGRPKGSKGLAQIVEEVCRETIVIKDEKGRRTKVPKIKAIMMQAVNQALRGETKAMQACFQIMRMFPTILEPAPQILPRPILQVEVVKTKNGRPVYHEEEEEDC